METVFVKDTTITKQRRMFYLGNKHLKAAGVQVHYTKAQLQELKKCHDDYIYFICNYVHTVHPDRGLILMDLFGYQRNFVTTIHKNRFTIGKSPRQTGKSQALCAYLLWYALFHSHKTSLLLANDSKQAKKFLARVRTAYEELPFWLQQGVEEWNKTSLIFENGSKIFCGATTQDTGRGETISFLVLDEFAFVKRSIAEEFMASVLPTITSGKTTKIAIISTPKGMNHFYKLWTEAVNGTNGYMPVEWRWDEFPGHGEQFKQEQIALLGEDKWLQEYECEFIGSASSLISSPVLREIPIATPVKTDDNLQIYNMPEPKHQYSIHADCGHGLSQDYSTCNVIDITKKPFVQVAVYRSNYVDPLEFPSVINHLGRLYNEAMVLIELNDIGYQIANELHQIFEYENILKTKTKPKEGIVLTLSGARCERGLKMTTKSKKVGCSYLKTLIENKELIIQNYETIEELSIFNKKGSSYAADSGGHDDIVMGLVGFAWMTSQKLFREMTDISLQSDYRTRYENQIQDDLLPPVVVDDNTSDNFDVMFSQNSGPDDEFKTWTRVM